MCLCVYTIVCSYPFMCVHVYGTHIVNVGVIVQVLYIFPCHTACNWVQLLLSELEWLASEARLSQAGLGLEIWSTIPSPGIILLM